MSKLYCYYIGICDYFEGTYSFKDYFYDTPEDLDPYSDPMEVEEKKTSKYSHIKTRDQLRNFLFDALLQLSLKKSFWEGDFRSDDDLRISFIPRGDSADYDSPACLLYIKQNNNGSTFVVSEISIGISQWEGQVDKYGFPTSEDIRKINNLVSKVLD